MLYKKFGGENFAAQTVGEAKLRQLAGVDAPYLSASGEGFTARKRGGTNEVWLDAPQPETVQGAIQYAVIGSNEYSFAGATLGTKFKKTKLWTGEYIGRGRTATSVPPQVKLWDRNTTTYPMYTAEKPGALYFRRLFKPYVDGWMPVQQDTRIVARAEFPQDVRQGNYGEPPVTSGILGWDNGRDFGITYYPAFWSGRTAFVGWVAGWQVYATPNVVWDGTADGNGMYRGKAVVDLTIYRDVGEGEVLQHRVELQFPAGTPQANEVPGTITVLRPGVFVVLAGQSLLNAGVGGNGHDATDAHIALWHNFIAVETDGEDWFVGVQAHKLHEGDSTVWSTADARYNKTDFIQTAARLVSQSPGVLCEDGKSILYAVNNPWTKKLDIQGYKRAYAVAYIRVGVDGLINSGVITTPQILIASQVNQVELIPPAFDKARNIPPACDLLYCGGGVILCRVREFTDPRPVNIYTTLAPEWHVYAWPLTSAPPLQKFNRVELWRSTDNGSTWAKMPAGNGLPGALNVANIGIPSVIEARPGGAAKLVIPVRNEADGAIKISKSRDGGVTWSNPQGGYPSIISYVEGDIVGPGADFFALRGGGFVNASDAPWGYIHSSEMLHSYSGDSPPIYTYMPATTLEDDILGVPIVSHLYPAYDKALKEVVRVKIGSKDAPKDLLRPWVYDSAYKKPEEP